MLIRNRRFLPLAALFLAAAVTAPAPAASAQEAGARDVAAASVPAPESVLGFEVGADGRLAEWVQITDYMERLEAASPRVRLERIGESVLGRPMIMLVVTAESNHARLEEIRLGQARIADPRGVPEEELQRLVREQPAVVFIGASLHGNEIMATQMSMELAHRLATEVEYARALEDVVVLLVPGMNPDGLDITRDWFLGTRETPHAEAAMPWLYHYYVGHDNNRDFFMVTQPETRAVTGVLYERWFPHVVWDVHQMGSRGERFFIPPFADPLNPNLDPLLVRLTNLVGVQMAADMTAAGLTGISHRERFDLWWHGGGRTVPARHNMVGILSEAANARYADPLYIERDSLREPEFGSLYPEPWPGGWWRARDIVDYELVAARSLIQLLHRQRERFVRDKIALARRQVEKGAAGGPFAFVVPAAQRDPGSAAELLRVLRRGAVEVHEARAPFEASGRRYPAGTRVVLMAQPYRAHAKDLLEVQRYPDRRRWPGGPPDRPYDLAGWTLPLQMGVEVHEVSEPFATERLVRLDTIPVAAGTVRGSRGALAYALDPRMNAAHRAVHEVLAAGGQLNFASIEIRAGNDVWPAGAPLVWGVPDLRQRVERWAIAWGLDAVALPRLPHEAVAAPRVGLYRPWTASIDEGWTRWLFEEWAVPFDSIRDAQLRAGDLHARFDAIVVPSIAHRELMRGSNRAHPDYAGGIGEEGAAALRAFVEAGGTLVLLDAAVGFAIEELGLPLRDVNAAQDTTEADYWFAPGSLLRVLWDPSHPVAAGMPEESAVFYARSPVLEVLPDAGDVRVLARYPQQDVLLSGYAQGEHRVTGHAAAVEARLGRGRVILFAFRPQHRAQPHQTFKPLFNALYPRGTR